MPTCHTAGGFEDAAAHRRPTAAGMRTRDARALRGDAEEGVEMAGLGADADDNHGDGAWGPEDGRWVAEEQARNKGRRVACAVVFFRGLG